VKNRQICNKTGLFHEKNRIFHTTGYTGKSRRRQGHCAIVFIVIAADFAAAEAAWVRVNARQRPLSGHGGHQGQWERVSFSGVAS
jgi:hypothetical protein